MDVGPRSAGTANGENALRFGVDVDEAAAAQVKGVQFIGSGHAGLLVDGQQYLQGRVGDGIAVQHGKGHCHSNAVVAAQGGAPRLDPIPVHIQIQRVFQKIVADAAVLHADHIQVALEHHRRMVLISRRAILPDDDIAHRVLTVPQAPAACKFCRPCAGGGGVAGAVGNTAQLFKKGKHALRFQTGQYVLLHWLYLVFPVIVQSGIRAA